MRCKTCGADTLARTQYTFGEGQKAPALECERCGAILLDEGVAKSPEELDSVRLAVSARWAAASPFEPISGTHQATTAVSAAQVEGACSEVDLVVAQASLCLEFLFQVTDGEAWKAVADAQRSLDRIHRIVDELAKRCARATKRAANPPPPSAANDHE